MAPRSSAALQLAAEFVDDRKTALLLTDGTGRARVAAASSAGADRAATGAAGVGQALAAAFRHAFLPDGYPASVSSDYLGECDRLQLFCAFAFLQSPA